MGLAQDKAEQALSVCTRCGDPESEHDTQPRCRYNGWRNYETWVVKLWIDNEQSTYKEAIQNVQIWADPAHGLKEWVVNMIPDLGASLAADLLNAALCEVDWQEIADAYLEEVS